MSTKSTKIHLVIIDGQNDFCNPNGALYVPGAAEGAVRTGKMISDRITEIDDIHQSADSHHRIDIAHPSLYRGKKGP